MSDYDSDDEENEQEAPMSNNSLCATVPTDGNKLVSQAQWTDAEHMKADTALKAHARWEVSYALRTIRSVFCERKTINPSCICGPCTKLSHDRSFKNAVQRVSKFHGYWI
jgi:hypothetical protein